ncbi:iron-regulated transcriptional activator Aft1p [Monosporozyma unispora]
MVIHQSEQNNNGSGSGVSSSTTSTATSTSSTSSSSTSSAVTATTEDDEDSHAKNTVPSHQHDPILRNEDGSMLTTPQNIPMVISKDQNKLIHLDPVPNFKEKADIKPWLQKIFYPMGIEIVIERSDNTKVVFKCKASKRGRKSRKSSTNGTPNNTTSTFEDTVKECAENFIIHDNKVKTKNNNNDDIPQPPSRVKKKRAVSRFNVCPFRIRATYSLKRHKWSIVVINNTHSHELNFDPNSDEYKKFKAKLREDNDLEAIKKFDELEYRKRSNLPIQTAMIPCDCGMTNEIESFNIVIPNTNPKTSSTTTTKQDITNKKPTPSPKAIPTPTSGSKRTINDLIIKKSDKIVPSVPIPSSAPAVRTNTTEQISLDDIINNYSKIPLKSTSFLNNPDWNINLLSDHNPENNHNNNTINNNTFTNTNNPNQNHLFYNLMNNNSLYNTNNDSSTDIIQAREKIDDEENDDEVGVPLQRDNEDYEYNGTNQIANEYYHNNLDSYNTDHFYKFNGPFDSGNIILTNKYNANNNVNDMNHELLSNNFIDDPLLNESHLNTLNFNTNLGLNINNVLANTTITNNNNFTNDNNTEEDWTNISNNVNTSSANAIHPIPSSDFNLINSNNNIIDLNEIDFTDIFSGGTTTATSNKLPPQTKQDESPLPKSSEQIPMVKNENTSPSLHTTTGEVLSKELKQFIVHLEETTKTLQNDTSPEENVDEEQK